MNSDNGRGYFTVDNAVLRLHGAKVGVYGLSVYCYLRMCAGMTGYAWPDVSTIARDLAAGERTVQLTLAALERCGLVQRCKGPPWKRGRTNCYRFPPVPGTTDAEGYTVQTSTDEARSGGAQQTAPEGAPGAPDKLKDKHAVEGGAAVQLTPPPILGFRTPPGTPQALQMAALWQGRTALRKDSGPIELHHEVVIGFDALLAAGMEAAWLQAQLDALPKPHDCWFSDFRRSVKASWAAVKAGRTRKARQAEAVAQRETERPPPDDPDKAAAVWKAFQEARSKL